MTVQFIPTGIVLIVHSDLIRRYGGLNGIRDVNFLESALARPKVTNGRKFAHVTLFDKAAAYGYHLCKNHPFVDGNKRIAFTLMDMFVQKNGWEIIAQEEEAYDMMIKLADGKLSKAELARWLKLHSTRISR